MELNQLIPSLLVFSLLHRFPCPSNMNPNKLERFESLIKARIEMQFTAAVVRTQK